MSEEIIEVPEDEPIPHITVGTLTLSDGTEIAVKDIPEGATQVTFRRLSGYTGDCMIDLTVSSEETAADEISAALEVELVSKTKVDEKTAEEIRTIQKAKRTQAVNSIVVTISTGKAFDGDEIAQSRMTRTITAMGIAGVTEAFWTLATNETVAVTIAELSEAVVLSIQEMAALWPLEQYEV